MTAAQGRPPLGAPWMATASGAVWPLLAPQPHMVRWRDVAEALARICRFGGHLDASRGHYSVAEHCCRVADILPPETRLYGLLHDAHEAYLGDMTAPLKEALRLLGAGDAMRVLADIHDRALFGAAMAPWPMPAAHAALVQWADLRLLATERRDLLAPDQPDWDMALPEPLPRTIRPWSWARAADEWLGRLNRWMPETPAAQETPA